ncbi:MAG TPA: serine/threonine-protein kinase [Planctomycetota bacterium]|nr:serine/threonine-protein kinase [Planctomycetota bacterium]
MGPPESEPRASPDPGLAAGLNDFFAAFLSDCEAGSVRTLSEYQALFPAQRDQIAAEFAAFEAGADEVELPDIPEVELEHVIGRGGQGIVYRGRQAYLDRAVAVKVLAPTLVDPHFASRFRREARTLAGLTHPHIVACYAAGVTEAGTCYLVMEFVPGPTLRRWLDQNGRLPHRTAVTLARDLASALAHAQATGVVHRDVKPENVLLQPLPNAPDSFAYRAKLADLGLARPLRLDRHQSLATPAGMVIGTPSTMAPEQFDDPDHVDHRADIYGLGCVLYHALTGRPAFDDRRMTELMVQKHARLGPDPRREAPDLPQAAAALVRRMTAQSPALRPATYDLLLAELDELLAHSAGQRIVLHPGRRRSWPFVAALAVLSVGASVVGYLWSTRRAATARVPIASAASDAPPVVTPAVAQQPLPRLELFAEGEDPFAGWDCDGEPGFDGVPNLNMARGMGTARRTVSCRTFTLQGKLEPQGRFTSQGDQPCTQTGVRIEFGETSAVQLDLRPNATGCVATLRRLQRGSDGGWQDAATIATASGAWCRGRAMPFHLGWGPDGLAYRLGDGPADAPLQFASGAAAPDATAGLRAVVLFVEGGRTCFGDFELRGR